MRVIYCLSVLSVGSFFLCACHTTPPDPAASVKIPKHFSAEGTAANTPNWWESFGSQQLNHLIQTGLKQNLDLLATWERLEQAEATYRQSKSGLFPLLQLTGSASRTESESQLGTTETSTQTLGVNTSYELDLWGRVRSNRNAAFWRREATREDLQTAALSLASALARNYFQLLETQQLIALYEQQMAYNQQIRSLIELRMTTGQSGLPDLLRQDQAIESKQGALIQTQKDLRLLKNVQQLLLGQSPNAFILQIPSTMPKELPPLPQTGIPSDILNKRPDVRAGFARLQAANADWATAVADRFPRITLSASLSTSQSSSMNFFEDWVRQLAGNLTLPIIDAGSRRNNADRTHSAAQQALFEYRKTLLNALHEVENALIQENAQERYLTSLAQQVELSGQAATQLQNRYEQGSEFYLNVLSALNSYQSLQQQYEQALRQQRLYRIELHGALAGHLDLTKPNLN
jgi:NodT family efflux transporter outer membrane factor (OMF) lipoprotein